jgi:NADH-quinone oxidoreductase subunit M
MTLTLVTFLPLFGAILLLFLPREEEGLHRGVALTTALAAFAASLFMLPGFDAGGFNLVIDKEWVPSLGIHYKLGVDGISLWLVLLTTFLVPIVLLSSWGAIHRKVREFCIAMLVLETGMLGTFLALDLFFFYVFWEVMLIPMYLIIGIWGGDRRLYASIKFVLYTMVGSLLMVVAILYLYVRNYEATKVWTFDYQALSPWAMSAREQIFCFAAFALAFAIKVPLFPLHTWLPDAHVEAPTAGSVLLAAVMLKMGTYGFLRYAMPLFPLGVTTLAPLISVLAVIGIIYGSLVAFAQKDIKKMIAYSSVAHLGFVVLGLMIWNEKAVDGALYVMLAHGISTGGLFLCIGVLYERRHTRRIDEFGGLAAVMPRFTAIFLIITLASIGLPGLCGFVGEFLVLIGTFVGSWTDLPALVTHPKLLAVLAATGVILSAVYMLYLFQKVMFGPVSNARNRELPDLSARELTVFLPVVLMAFWLGLYPNTFLSTIDPAVHRVVSQFSDHYKIATGEAPAAPAEPKADEQKPAEPAPTGPIQAPQVQVAPPAPPAPTQPRPRLSPEDLEKLREAAKQYKMMHPDGAP